MTEVHPWLQVYLAAGIVTLVISAGLALRERWRRRGDPDSLISLLDPRTPDAARSGIASDPAC
jgi:hypothetical protein